jgi:RHS repeat-associated protein
MARQAFEAFNTPLHDAASAPTVHGYNGERHDPRLGLLDQRSRLLDPSSGRFTWQDSFVPPAGNFHDANLYTYVAGNAANAVDPTGQALSTTQLLYDAAVTSLLLVATGCFSGSSTITAVGLAGLGFTSAGALLYAGLPLGAAVTGVIFLVGAVYSVTELRAFDTLDSDKWNRAIGRDLRTNGGPVQGHTLLRDESSNSPSVSRLQKVNHWHKTGSKRPDAGDVIIRHTVSNGRLRVDMLRFNTGGHFDLLMESEGSALDDFQIDERVLGQPSGVPWRETR